jgi:hypothetical protein
MRSSQATVIPCAWRTSLIRVKSPRETVAQALVGDYRPEHLFTLKQLLDVAFQKGCSFRISQVFEKLSRPFTRS